MSVLIIKQKLLVRVQIQKLFKEKGNWDSSHYAVILMTYNIYLSWESGQDFFIWPCAENWLGTLSK